MRPSDWEQVSQIYLQGIETGIATFQREVPAYEIWNKSHLEHNRIVIEQNGIISGWAALSPISSRPVYSGVAELSLYISPDFRGQGVGTKLLNALIEQSENNGIWTLQSGIFQENSASIKLHEKCGFRMVGYREKIGKDYKGVWHNNVLM